RNRAGVLPPDPARPGTIERPLHPLSVWALRHARPDPAFPERLRRRAGPRLCVRWLHGGPVRRPDPWEAGAALRWPTGPHGFPRAARMPGTRRRTAWRARAGEATVRPPNCLRLAASRSIRGRGP